MESEAVSRAISATEQTKRLYEFIEQQYQDEVIQQVRKGNKFLVIDFSVLSKFDPDIADALLEQPDEIIRAAELAIQQLDVGSEIKNFKVRIKNLPASQNMMIRNIRSEHLNKLFTIEGIVRQKSDVRPQVTSAKFECPSCGNILNVLQLDPSFKEPSRCGCGRKGKFKQISKELIDAQGLVLEESSESLEGGFQPKRINVLLKEDLVSPFSEKRSSPGSKVIIVGQVKEVPIITRSGATSTRFDLMIEANFVESSQESFYEVQISEEDEKQIIELAQDPRIFERLVNSLAPSIYGYDKIKEALILQIMGGVRKVRKDKVVSRGDMHILLVGDPGAGKSALLKRANVIAPKGRYVSGKGVSGAGLTAAVVRDEFIKGWSLEAGAMVLSSDGLCCIDEMDKISPEDRAAMHEALENQSYHYNTEILFSDGTTEKIGKFVDTLIEENKKKIIAGKDCEILKVDDIELLTTDFKDIFPIKASMVSRHKAPEYFIKIQYSNGRHIIVTPEHPVFVFLDGNIKEIPAEDITVGLLAPSPRNLPIKRMEKKLAAEELSHFNNKPITFPHYVNHSMARLLGYIATEGHAYYSEKNRYAEVGISNTDPLVIKDASHLFTKTFNTQINTNVQIFQNRPKATKDLTTVRLCSIPFYKYMMSNFRGSVNGARNKYIDNVLRCASSEIQLEFLRSAFKGDGFVDSKRFGFSTSSFELAKGYQDLLLFNFIFSRIDEEKREDISYYKVTIVGTECYRHFIEKIVEEDDRRLTKIKRFYSSSKQKRNERDIVPGELLITINDLLKEFGISDGYFYINIKRRFNANKDVVLGYIKKIENRIEQCYKIIDERDTKKIRTSAHIQVRDIAKLLNVSHSTIYNLEKRKGEKEYALLLEMIKKQAKEKIKHAKNALDKILSIIESPIRFLYIKKVEKIKNNDMKWVYDVTVEPTRTFISESLVLHNTVSISKANIQATLIARTTVLAAANPKFGRFDPYGIVADQIDMPPTLINRFDLIFPIKDLPDDKRDKEMASHILKLHQEPDIKEPDIPTELLRKYIAYTRQKVHPKLTDSALEEIQEFYLKMRSSGGGEGSIKSIPISARQLEALVRLSEASARVRLSDKVMKKDARRAIELVEYCLREVGLDRETGKIDIDRIATGISASARSHMMELKEIIMQLEGKIGKTIPISSIVEEAKARNISEESVDDAIERLKRAGDLFEPRRNFISRI